MKSIRSRRSFLAKIAAVLAVGTAGVWAAPGEMGLDHASVRAALAKQNAVTPALMKLAGVLGTAIGDDERGGATVIIYVNQKHPAAATLTAPAGTRIELTDEFVALAGKPTAGIGVSHTAKQTAPIQLGTSGGWRSDLANGYCCGGTLGSLVQVNGVQYILSNYHVLEADIVLGGNSLIAGTGDAVIQPGLIDVGCNASSAQNVATLVKLGSLPFYNVDVGLAQVTPGMVRTDGSILEIGTISSQTVGATLNKAVKKSGRTSGLTRSKISGLNATINVTYENECAGGTAFTKTFTGQIVVTKGSTFLKGGDSGSLMVEDVATNPRAIGLLYAGSSTSAIANPIGDVLTFVGSQLNGTATMVGN